MGVTTVKIEEVSACTDFFSREETNEEIVKEYAELLEFGTALPPILAFKDTQTGKYTILDGFHTYHAALKAGLPTVAIRLTEKESELDLFIEGVESNAKHGLRLSNKDRRRNIEKILGFDATKDWTSGRIAKIVGMSDRTVESIRKTLSPKISGIEVRKGVRNGVEIEWSINRDKTEEHDNPTSINRLDAASKSSDQADDGSSLIKEIEVLGDQKIKLISSIKNVQHKCVSYSRVYDSINDGKEKITSSFLEKLMSSLTVLQEQAAGSINLVNEVMGGLHEQKASAEKTT